MRVPLTAPVLACPCHRSAFDPAAAGKVLGGPAPRPPYRFSIRLAGPEAIVEDVEKGAERVLR